MDAKLLQGLWLIPTSMVGIVMFAIAWEWLVDQVLLIIGELYVRLFKRNSR